MDPHLSASLPSQHEIDAHPSQKHARPATLVVAAVGFGLLGSLLLLCAIPYALPFLTPFATHVLGRLREVSFFLLVTTVIAVGIFKSPWKAADRQKHSSDQYPLSSIFGESGGSDMIKYALESADPKLRTRPDDFSIARAKVYNAMDLGSTINADCESDASSSRKAEYFSVSSSQKKASEAAYDKWSSRDAGKVVASTEKTTLTHRRNLSESREESVYEGDPRPPSLVTQRKLHRRASSLDDSINYEPALEAEVTRS